MTRLGPGGDRAVPRGRVAPTLFAALLAGLVVLTACGPSPSSETADSAAAPAREAASAEVAVPEPDTTDMEPEVAEQLREARREVLADPESAAAWGRFGKVAHAHELWEEARIAYQRARELDPTEERWPYFLGDVLSVVGTELEAATRAFERTLELRPGYAPAHMRLGRVLVARGRPAAAARQFERALELAPDLQQARVGLAQIRLSENKLDEAEKLLDAVLAAAPRHAQALSTLGQVYMRQGRREEAREIARRAREDAALYNLFSDPLMREVVQEEASSVLLWERAKAFFDNGNYEQAARGLELVVRRMPSNPDVHHQLAVAYGNLGQPEQVREHLERVLDLDPERVEALIQLAMLHLDQQRPAAAIPHLRRALELAPDDPDAGWLLGRARVLSGDLEGGLAAFERAQAQATAAGRSAPGWAHNEWGSALAQTGRPHRALEHFRAALEADPDDAQALFYMGLIHEGLGDVDRAVESFCRSLQAQPNPPAANRLQALGRSCN